MLNIFSYPVMKFPEGFLWGSATAAHQIEGDDFNSHEYHQQVSRSFPEISGKACDSYRLYREDVKLLKKIGHKAYRLSIPWSRIEPRQGEFNAEAVEHYRDLLRRLKEEKITTFVTLLHGSTPEWFEQLGNIQVRKNIPLFLKYIQYLVPKIAEYADFFLVFNEFNIAGGRVDEDYRAIRSAHLIAHALGREVIKGIVDRPVSSAHALRYCQPENAFDRFDRIFAELDDWKTNEFFFHAVRSGEIVLPYMDAEFIPEVQDSVDFWAVNYYCRNLISGRRKTADSSFFAATHQRMIDMPFYLEEFFPEGLSIGLQRLKDKPVYITENGLACEDDRWRMVYLSMMLAALHEALKKGVDVRGYLHWSTMDNYEWYTFKPRFGLVHVNFKTFQRTPKTSAWFYKEIIEQNGISGDLIRKYLPEVPVFRTFPGCNGQP